MSRWRRFLVGAIGALGLLGLTTATVGADGGGDRLIQFDSMTPVTGSAVGAVNDRGIKGGGLPWVITSGTGSVDHQGDVSVTVKGLVIPVLGNKNPVASFKATVSCITPDGVVNVSTPNFPASAAGDSTINATVDLPHPCKDPIVFVTSPTGSWFAESNSED
jgi:hypothetical protein